MTAIPDWARDPRWGDATGALLLFSKYPDHDVARARVVMTFDRRRRHDIVWLYKLRDEIADLFQVKPRDDDERDVRAALEDDWDVERGRICRLPESYTGDVKAYLWDVEVPLRYLPDGVDTGPGRENWLWPLRANLANRTGVRGLPYSRPMRDQRPEHFIRAIQPRGVHREAALVQANKDLWNPGVTTLPGVVLISFERVNGLMPYLHDLAARASDLKTRKEPRDKAERWVRDALLDEKAVYHRRDRLPKSFTGGPVVYLADLWIFRPYLRHGRLGSVRQFPVLAEPGDEGGLELLPYDNPHAFDPPLEALPADD